MFLFLLSFLLLGIHVFAMETWVEATNIFGQTHKDIQRLGLDLTDTDASHPRQLTPTEVARVVSTDSVRRWLDTPRIFVFRGSPSDFLKSNPEAVTSIYELSNGMRCTTSDLFSMRPNGRVASLPWWAWTKCRDAQGNDPSPWR
jgi:hypothetical protein